MQCSVDFPRNVPDNNACMDSEVSSLRLKHPRGLAPGDVHVWRTTLCVQEHVLRTYAKLLSPDESVRAARFTFAEDQRRFVVARAVLRLLLAEFFECNPAKIEFTTNEFGKPSVAGPSTLHFNVSHSYDLAAYAFGTQEVGIDVEWKRPIPDALDIARRFFTAPEIAAMERVPFDDRSNAFLMYWTHKEAGLKACGLGLSGDLASLDVRMDQDPRVLTIEDRSGAIPRLIYLQTLDFTTDYVGALATSYPTERVLFHDWEHQGALVRNQVAEKSDKRFVSLLESQRIAARDGAKHYEKIS
jgi:4'-phosphopantetheinyl transferase